MKKKMIAMLLAGGQGSRLGVLTDRVAKPAVSFGGKYKIIDFPLSNCVNSGVDTVGVLTQYRPLKLNAHIGVGIPWDLDHRNGGVFVLPPYEKNGDSEWYTGTANAIYQNIEFIDEYSPDYVLILSGDHIYRMDYEDMLEKHRNAGAEVSIAVMPVPWEEASRFGIVIADEDGQISAFEEKPEKPRSNLASMGIYIFNWPLLRYALTTLADVPNCDFGKNVIPFCFDEGRLMYTYKFTGYWKDVGTLSSYWEAHMDLLRDNPEFELYSKRDHIYTRTDDLTPQFIGPKAKVSNSLISEGCRIYGNVTHSVISPGVEIGEDCEITDSVIMAGTHIGRGCRIDKAIISEKCVIGDGTVIGDGEYADSKLNRKIYCSDLAVIDEKTEIPAGVVIGRNTAISGRTLPADYPDGQLPSGEFLIAK